MSELISKTKQDIVDWRDLSTKELAAFYAKLSIEMPELKVPSLVRLWFMKRNPFAGAFSRFYVQRIWKRWYFNIWNPLKWVEVWLFEWTHGFRFLNHLLYEEIEKKPVPFMNCHKSRNFAEMMFQKPKKSCIFRLGEVSPSVPAGNVLRQCFFEKRISNIWRRSTFYI